MRYLPLLCVVVVACGAIDGGSLDGGRMIDAGADAPKLIEGPTPPCDPSRPFQITRDTSIDVSTSSENYVRLSGDQLTAYFISNRVAGDDLDIFFATRPAKTAEFGQATALSSLNTTAQESSPTVTADSLTIVFSRVITSGEDRLFIASRADAAAAFGTPSEVVNVNLPNTLTGTPFLMPDGLALYFVRRGADNLNKLWRATRPDVANSFQTPVTVDELNIDTTSTSDAVFTPDGLVVYFASDRPGGMPGSTDIWTASRASTAEPFGTPTHVDELATSTYDWPTWVSPDGCQLYFGNVSGLGEIWVGTKPVVGS